MSFESGPISPCVVVCGLYGGACTFGFDGACGDEDAWYTSHVTSMLRSAAGVGCPACLLPRLGLPQGDVDARVSRGISLSLLSIRLLCRTEDNANDIYSFIIATYGGRASSSTRIT
jgi:hypothetical protein